MRDIKLADGGTLPKSGTGKLELVYGNNVLANFRERGNNSSGYWETGELPDIDLMKDSMFMILDQDAYYNSQSSGGFRPMQELTEREHLMFHSQPRNIS